MVRPLLTLLIVLAAVADASAQRSAQELFGSKALPADMPSQPIGFYSRGCLAGGVALAPDGPYWQAMRLSRNRHWGLPILVDYIQTLAKDAATKDGWPGLLVGDMVQPRGGPMPTGHASHQNGLDVDIWLRPMPDRRLTREERETLPFVAVVEAGPHEVYRDRWTDAHGRLIRRAALDQRVERIFVAPGIKKKLCETAGSDRDWLRKIRPYYGHNAHMHIRLSCPPGTPCRAQSPPPPGDSCGAPLAWWFTSEPYAPADKPAPKPKRRVTAMSELPPACRDVLVAPDRPGALTMLQAFASPGAQGAAPAMQAIEQAVDQAVQPDGAEPVRLPRPRPAGQ